MKALMLKKIAMQTLCFYGLSTSLPSFATTVQFQTVLGNFEVNLYDKTTPQTVQNFLSYVNAGAYTNMVVHRVVPNFVVQMGGYALNPNATLSASTLPIMPIAAKAPVINEPVYSNKRATLAMAKLKDQPNSATSEFFINLADNSVQLDGQNAGFTVFGEVTGSGMDVINAITGLSFITFLDSPLPLRNYTQMDYDNKVPFTEKHLVVVNQAVVLDSSPDTAAPLTPSKNTIINASTGDKKGGAFGVAGLWLVVGVLWVRRRWALDRARPAASLSGPKRVSFITH